MKPYFSERLLLYIVVMIARQSKIFFIIQEFLEPFSNIAIKGILMILLRAIINYVLVCRFDIIKG